MSFEQKVIAAKSKLNYNEQQTITWIYQHQNLLDHCQLADIAQQVHTSKSFVSKLIKKIGYSSFAEFRIDLKSQAKKTPATDSTALLELQQQDLNETFKLLEKINFAAIFQCFDHANFIYCYGTGHSNQDCIRELSRNLMSIGNKRIVYLSGKSALESIIPLIDDKDCFIISSHSGESPSLINILQLLKLKGAQILSITVFSNNQLVRLADFNLFYFTTLITNPIQNNQIYSFLPLNLCIDTLVRKYLTHLEKI